VFWLTGRSEYSAPHNPLDDLLDNDDYGRADVPMAC
jgi:hypothetical protein